MEIKVDTYVWNKQTGKCADILHDTVTDEDIEKMVREWNNEGSMPMWFNADVHEIREVEIAEVKTP